MIMKYYEARDIINDDYEAAKTLGLDRVETDINALRSIALELGRLQKLEDLARDFADAVQRQVGLTTPFDKMTQEKWDYLEKYYIDPLISRIDDEPDDD